MHKILLLTILLLNTGIYSMENELLPDTTELLFNAMEQGDEGQLLTALQGKINLVARRNEMTPLLFAAWKGLTDVCIVLADKGADLESPDWGVYGNYDTALALAAREHHDATCMALLDKGAYVNQKNFAGDTPITLAVKRNTTDLAQAILEHLCIYPNLSFHTKAQLRTPCNTILTILLSLKRVGLCPNLSHIILTWCDDLSTDLVKILFLCYKAGRFPKVPEVLQEYLRESLVTATLKRLPEIMEYTESKVSEWAKPAFNKDLEKRYAVAISGNIRTRFN